MISEKLSKGNKNSLLFPYINRDGVLGSWIALKPQKQLNNLLKPYKLASISASRFRKTRSNQS
jgi:hypothetical protein